MMITATCNNEQCPNAQIAYNVLGSPDQVECGGCKQTLTPTDHRDDPTSGEWTLTS